jgi:hypothetical protein
VAIAGASRRRRGLLAAALAAVAIAGMAIAVGAFGGDGGSDDFEVAEGALPLGEVRAGSVASLAECGDWNEGTTERKRATVVDIRRQLTGGGVPDGRPSLSDQEAFDVFERACASDFTERFHLYKIYFRAAAFNDFDPQELIDAYPPETLVPAP